MCISSTVSYSAAAMLVTTGFYAVQQARRLPPAYWLLATVPLFFGIQQAFEGRVWQMLDAGEGERAVPFALGFHFFSHFLWLWWFPLCSYVVERGRFRRRLFLGIALFGGLAGGLVFFTLLFNADWMSVEVEQHSIVYRASPPLRGPFSIGIPPSALYALIVLVPLLFSSQRQIRIFGALIAASTVPASLAWGFAFVSVWCFFAAVLSLYLVYMIRRLAEEQGVAGWR
jgi:hypothetical protein